MTVAYDRYLVASGLWTPAGLRWVLVYDLDRHEILHFGRDAPDAGTTESFGISPDGRLLVQTTSNSRIYIFDVGSGKLILKGNYIDDELIVYDDRGYYASTPDGAHFVFLKFPGMAGYHAFQQFSKTLNRPDVIKNILAGTSAAPPPGMAPPPQLSIQLAGSGVTVQAASSRPLKAVRLFIDGQLEREVAAQGLEFRSEIALSVPPQARWISAVAVDAAGAESIAAGQALPANTGESDKTLHGIVVGTDTYLSRDIDKLDFAAADARQMADILESQGKGYYKESRVTKFLDARDLRDALPRKVREVADAASARDTIVLFVAGHGFREKGKLYLATAESDMSGLPETSIAWDDLARAFAGTRARVVVMLDACHAGAAAKSGTNDEAVSALASQRTPFTVIAAAKGRQSSFEHSNVKGGLFTIAIASAVQSRAATDADGNGAIELAELYREIKRTVVTATKARQTPWLARSEMVGEVPLF